MALAIQNRETEVSVPRQQKKLLRIIIFVRSLVIATDGVSF